MTYKIAYSKIQNAGNLLNEYIIERIFGIDMVCANSYNEANIVGIGSCLEKYQYSDSFKRREKQFLLPNSPIYVWGTGFMYKEPDVLHGFYNKNLKFSAVRGSLSKKRIEKILNKELNDIPLCDGGY